MIVCPLNNPRIIKILRNVYVYNIYNILRTDGVMLNGYPRDALLVRYCKASEG